MANEQPGHAAKSPEYSVEALRTLSNIPGISIYVTDYYTCELLMCNNTYAAFHGLDADTAVGTLCYKTLGYESRCDFCKYDKLLDQNGNLMPPYHWEYSFENYGITLQITNQAIRWVDGRLANMAVSIDITKRKQMEDKLHHLAFFDQSLKTPNHEHMKHDMKASRSFDCIVSIRLPDIGQINNMLGRAHGEALLRMMRDYILGMKISNATLYTGKVSDLCILFQGSGENKDFACSIAKKIHGRCQKPWEAIVGGQRQSMLAPADVSVVWLDFTHEHFFSYLYRITAYALDMSRKRESVIVCGSDFRAGFDAGIKLEHGLKNAVRDNMCGFSVVYQPVVDMRSRKWIGIEALCRWNSPEFGSVPPDLFIPAAESLGLINPICLWVLEQAVIHTKKWSLDMVDDFVLGINISPTQLAVPNLDKMIMGILNKHSFLPKNLGIEITESNELNFSKPTMEVITRLSEMGVAIILDDFGTGYSSFSSLYKLPVKVLKTDRSLITGIETDNYLQCVINAIIELAHSSNMQIVSEGVENASQEEFLLNKGVDYVQGYFYSHPLSANQIEEKLNNFYTPLKPA